MAHFARGNPARWWKGRSCGGPSRAPRSLHIGTFRRWAGWITLSFLVLLVGSFWYLTNPARISRLSETLFSRVLGGHVKVRTGRLSLSGTLLLSGVEVRTADPEPAPAGDVPIFSAENVEVRIDWLSLFSGRLSATQLVADTPVFRPIEDRATGHWNYERMHPTGLANAVRGTTKSAVPMSLPVVILRNAHVRWGEVRDDRLETTGETVIEGDLTPDATKPSLYRFQFLQMAAGNGGKAEVGAVLRGSLDTAANTFFAGTENVEMTETLKNGLPRIAREWCEEHHLEGRLSRLAIGFNEREGLTVAVAFQNVGMMFMIEPEQGIGMGEVRPSYPVDIRNVSGEMKFLLNGPSIHVSNLTGEVLKYRFVADADMQGTTFNDPYRLSLRFPDAVLQDRYPPIFMAFLTAQDLIARVAPHGRMDIALDMQRDVARGPVNMDGRIDLHDAQMRFAMFPFPMDHLNGRITFDRDSCTFHDVTAKGDMNDVLITGTTGTNWAHRAVDFTVSSNNLYFDDRLAAAMPAKYREIWDLFNIKAHGGFVCRVTRSNNVLDLPKVVVDVTVDDGGGYVRDMPFEFKEAKGQLHFEADETRINNLTATTGKDGSGRVRLTGRVLHPEGDVENLKPELHITADVPIDDDLLQGLPESFAAKLKDVTLGGRLKYTGTLQRGETEAHGIQVTGEFDWLQGSLRAPLAGGVDLSGITAHATVTPTAVDLKTFETTVEMAAADAVVKSPLSLALSGAYEIATSTGEFQLTTGTKDFVLPAKPGAFLPGEWAEKWQSYQPMGTVDLNGHAVLHLLATGAAPSATQPAVKLSDTLALDSYGLTISAHDVSVKNADWPDAVEKLNGTVGIAPESVTMTSMSATLGNVMAKWAGVYVPGTGAVSLVGSAASEGWPGHWLTYLPEAIRNNLDTKRPDVSLVLQLSALTREGTDKPWAFDGRMDTGNFAITGPLPARAEKIAFVGKGTFDPAMKGGGGADPYTFAGTLSASNLLISSHLLDSVECTVDASALRHAINITEITGKVAEGALHGNILVHTAYDSAGTAPASMPATAAATQMVDWASGGYQADLVLNDADLSHLVLPADATEEDRKKSGAGRVFASLSLTETFGSNADRTGRGELQVRDATIYNVPLSMGLMQIVTLRLPVAKSFHSASMSYYLRNNEINFEKILLESSGINIAGIGTVRISDKKMDLSFVTESPHEVVIPIITPVFSEFRNQLLQLSVTGTLDEPKVTPVPLSGIANTLKNILPGQHADATH